MRATIEIHFLNRAPIDPCDIVCTSNHSCNVGRLERNNNPTPATVLHLGDDGPYFGGSSVVLNKIPPNTYLKGDGITVDTTIIKKPVSFGLPTCDCCPLVFWHKQSGMMILLHISTETLALYETKKREGEADPYKIPVLHKIFPKGSLIDPKQCEITMGPCISSCCYEFGLKDAELLKEQLEAFYPEINLNRLIHPHVEDENKVYLDFPGIIEGALITMDVKSENISREHCDCTVCTKIPGTEKPMWHSYRRIGDTKDHNWAVVVVSPPDVAV